MLFTVLLIGCAADIVLHVEIDPEFSDRYGDASGALPVWQRPRQASEGLWSEEPSADLGFVTPDEPLPLSFAGGPVEILVQGTLSEHPPCSEAGCNEAGWTGDAMLVVTGHGWHYPNDPEIEVNGTEVAAGSATDVVVNLRADCECSDI